MLWPALSQRTCAVREPSATIPITPFAKGTNLSRRRFLMAATGFLASVTNSAFANQNQVNFWNEPRRLRLYRPSTNEWVNQVYWADGKVNYEGYANICRLLRDTRYNEAVEMDFVTLDIARGIQGWLENYRVDQPLIIHSGYRDPRTNAATEGAAKNSLHMLGQAIDLSIQGVSAGQIAQFGLYLSGGGVGYYPGRDFTHLDRGRVRFWVG